MRWQHELAMPHMLMWQIMWCTCCSKGIQSRCKTPQSLPSSFSTPAARLGHCFRGDAKHAGRCLMTCVCCAPARTSRPRSGASCEHSWQTIWCTCCKENGKVRFSYMCACCAERSCCAERFNTQGSADEEPGSQLAILGFCISRM